MNTVVCFLAILGAHILNFMEKQLMFSSRETELTLEKAH